jgi:hypothetical protein
MSQSLNVVIVASRCCHSREMFGMRFEQQSHDLWVVDWAFQLPEKAAKKEGYDQNDIKGTFSIDGEYPGCPYCHNMSFIYCVQCSKVSCYDDRSSTASCGWCGFSGQIDRSGISRLKAGGDR